MAGLPAGWTKQVSSKTGKQYFFNTKTGKSVWSLEEVNKLAAAGLAKSAPVQRKPVAASQAPSRGSTAVAHGSKQEEPVRKSLTPAQVQEEARKARADLQDKLDMMMGDLLKDESRHCIRVPAPDAITNYMIESAADEAGLLTQHFGVGSERFVLAYKEGSEPEELVEKQAEEEAADRMKAEHFEMLMSEDRPTRVVATHAKSLARHDLQSLKLKKVEPKKRDRRTVEDLMLEEKARKKPRTEE